MSKEKEREKRNQTFWERETRNEKMRTENKPLSVKALKSKTRRKRKGGITKPKKKKISQKENKRRILGVYVIWYRKLQSIISKKKSNMKRMKEG